MKLDWVDVATVLHDRARGRADTPRGVTYIHGKLYCRTNFLTHKSACLNNRIPTPEELTALGRR